MHSVYGTVTCLVSVPLADLLDVLYVYRRTHSVKMFSVFTENYILLASA